MGARVYPPPPLPLYRILTRFVNKVTCGALAGDAVLPALKSAAEAVDPEVIILAEAFLSRANGEEGAAGGAASEGQDDKITSLPAPSLEAQSILVDLGRTALKVAYLRCCRRPGVDGGWIYSLFAQEIELSHTIAPVPCKLHQLNVKSNSGYEMRTTEKPLMEIVRISQDLHITPVRV